MTKAANSVLAIASAIEAVGADGEPLARFKLMPFGNPFFGRDGRGPYILTDKAHAQQVIDATAAYFGSAEMAGDYDHQSVFGAVPGVGGKAVASSWVKALSAEADGIYVDVEWTAPAANAMRQREYRYVSPVFRHTKEGRVTRLVNFALTNTPNLDLPAIASAVVMQGAIMDLSKIAEALGLKPEATEADILAAITDMKGVAPVMMSSMTAVATALGLAKDAKPEEVAAAASTAKAAADAGPDPKKFVPKEGYDALAATVKKLDDERVTASVDAAIETGKLAPSMRQWGIDLASKDEPAFASFVKDAPTFEGAKIKTPAGDPKPQKGILSDEEKAVCSQMGVSEADFLKERDEERAV